LRASFLATQQEFVQYLQKLFGFRREVGSIVVNVCSVIETTELHVILCDYEMVIIDFVSINDLIHYGPKDRCVISSFRREVACELRSSGLLSSE